MCGLVGFWNSRKDTNNENMTNSLVIMAEKIKFRGPDSDGYWVDQSCGIALAHTRLSIQDLSDSGKQPMQSFSRKSVLIYNGEIYNSSELRLQLQQNGISFSGHSDTEVLLEGCELWGVESMISKCIGMFAFVLWNREKNMLSLVRDRLGVKPLYWGRQNGILYFASQPKAITVHPEFNGEIDRRVMRRFIQFAYVPAPDCIYDDLNQVRPGHLVQINSNGKTETIRYWNLPSIARDSSKSLFKNSFNEQVDDLNLLLLDSVDRRMIADVPLGGFLSGGVDSSTIIALMQAQSDRPIKTFSIGFNESGYNEAEYAREVACYLGTEHSEVYVSSQQILDLVPNIALAYDEPFADSSQLPTQLLCEITRQDVTVALSGDGGDELFSGYNRYLMAGKLKKVYKNVPAIMRKAFAIMLKSISPAYWDKISQLIPKRYRHGMFGDKLHKLADVISLEDFNKVYPHLLSYWGAGQQIVINEPIVDEPIGWTEARNFSHDEVANMQLMDTLSYMPDDILAKVDRASMHVGLEVRVPMIDHRVVEFALKLPHSSKMNRHYGKRVLREVLYKYVPKRLIERPKMGFAVPLDSWLRGPLRDWAESLLEPVQLDHDSLFCSTMVRKRWQEHLSGKRNWQYSLWNILMAQSWRRTWMV